MTQAEGAYTSQPKTKKNPKAGKKKAEKTNYHHNMDIIYQNSSTEPTPEGLHGTA